MMRWAGCAHDRRGRRPLWRAREPNVAARSEPVKGALVPVGRGMKIASMSGAKEPYIPSAEAVEFFAVAIGQRVSTWSEPQPMNSPREPDVPGKGWVKTGWHWPHRPRHNCQGYQY